MIPELEQLTNYKKSQNARSDPIKFIYNKGEADILLMDIITPDASPSAY